jgi:DNA-binding transcriptional ArsR family regulator
MFEDADIAAVGTLLGDHARASMLEALLSGEATTAGELARQAGISRSGASAHLRKLRGGGLITEEAAGRNRLFQLASPELAEALEALARVAPVRPVLGLREAEAARALKRGRTCYDHLAGELGVAVTEALVRRRILRADDGNFSLTKAGTAWFGELGVDVEAVRASRRSFARGCLDWSERRLHLAGSLGAALADAFFAHGWLRRLPGGRSVVLTNAGESWLREELELPRPRAA